MATNIPPHNLGEVVRRPHLPPRQPGSHPRRAPRRGDGAHSGPRLPHRRLHRRPGRDPSSLPHRPRDGRDASASRDRGREGRQGIDRHHRDPLPAQQGAAHREDRGAREGQAGRRHLRHPRRERAPGDAHRLDIRKGEPRQVILNNLYKLTPLQDTFGIIFLAIVDQRPKVLNILEASEHFLTFRREVVRRRTELRPPEGGGPGPHPRGARHCPRPSGRGHHAHPGQQDPGRGPGGPGRALRASA